MTWKCKANRDLPLNTTLQWNALGARDRIIRWAGWPEMSEFDPEKCASCFLASDDENLHHVVDGYKLPFADIVDGEPQAIAAGLRAARIRLHQTQIPDDLKDEIADVIDDYLDEDDEDDEPEDEAQEYRDAGMAPPIRTPRGEGEDGETLAGRPADDEEDEEDDEDLDPRERRRRRLIRRIGRGRSTRDGWRRRLLRWIRRQRQLEDEEGGDDDGDRRRDRRLNGRLSAPAGPLTLAAASAPRTYLARLIRSGRVRLADGSPGPFTIPAAALREALEAGRFDGISCFVDHPGLFQGPSLRNLAGYVTAATWNPADQAVDGRIRLLSTGAGQIVADLFDDLLRAGDGDGRRSPMPYAGDGRRSPTEPMPDVGLSLVFWPDWEGEGDALSVGRIRHVESVDFVFQPAAGGRVLQALSALDALEHGPRTTVQRLSSTHQSERRTQPMNDPTAPNDWLAALRSEAADALIRNSGLPAPTQDLLRRRRYATPQGLQRAIDDERRHLAALRAADVVQIGGTPPRSAHITLGRTSMEQVEAALLALLAGGSPPPGVAPLSGIRELYHLLSGDYEMHGTFQPERVHLANVNSSTMAALVANALNKVVVTSFQEYPKWWQPIVTETDFATLQDARWITLGGVGELPTVPEGGAYTELTWDDKTETSAFAKKGGYLGITIETIDKDDTNQLRSAPRALAQAAWLTLSKSIARIFTLNPAMSDGKALFHADHGNLGSSALTWEAFNTTQQAMMKQTELNSGERLGALNRPYYLLVPIELETTALIVLGTEGRPGTANNDANPFAQGDEHDARLAWARKRVIVCPIWTDATDWVALADPKLYPTIGLGYRYGRVPQIFSVASPTAGLMFTNDTMPIKVRFFYAVGPTDWRGMYKHVVAG